MKRYLVLMQTKKFLFKKETNSLKLARFLADLNIWKYAKIHDANVDKGLDVPFNTCIYVRKRES